MSDQAFEIYEQAQSEQHSRNEARRIRTRVAEARGKPHAAGVRWPFELMQNALDTGPRAGNTSVTISVRRKASHVIFEHDGTPFTSLELAALLSGGSSKEFESEVTTGRFGTGFLVTHVLAERVRLRGLFNVGDHLEKFELVLDRSGNEEKILENILACNSAIRAASPVVSGETPPSARFEYEITEGSTTFAAGFEALERSLPYLYGTRPTLGTIELEAQDNFVEVWSPGPSQAELFEDGCVEQRAITVQRTGAPSRDLRVFRFMTEADASAAALLVVERTGAGWTLLFPDSETPRVFREYPLRAATFVPMKFVLDGKFEPDQERSGLLMGPKDKGLLAEAFSAAVLGVRFAFGQKWDGAHLLASVHRPTTVFEPSGGDEMQWWCQQLLGFADRLARLPIVDCGAEFLPAITDDGAFAAFVIPRLLSSSSDDETTVERLWPLVSAATDLRPPRRELAKDWTHVCEGWHGLGVEIDENRITVQRLAENVRKGARTLPDLHVQGSQREWLARFLDVVGECWERRGGRDPSVLDGLLPNQHLRLCAPSELYQDGGVSDALKDICAELDHDVRQRLLLSAFSEIAEHEGLKYLPGALDAAVGVHLTEDKVLDETVRHLGGKLPEDENCDEESVGLQKGSVRLLAYLWSTQGEKAVAIARGLPLISRKERVVRWSPDRLMMAPVRTWHESARPFAAAYPDTRVLSDLYAGSDEAEGCAAALIVWGIAIPDPIATDEPAELRDRRLAAIASSDTENVVVSGQRFSQIALLPREVMNHCKVGVDEARALLGLLLNHVAPHDPSWQSLRTFKARRGRDDIEVTVREALWLADLKFMAWVPIIEEEGKSPVPHLANPNTLAGLLDSKWLENNDAAIKLLSLWFGFDELELRLLGLAADAEKRKELRASLARLVESGGADAELYASLAQELEARQRRERDVTSCRRLGLAVQEAIRQALEAHGLELTLVDRGFDYEVTIPPDNALDELASHLQVGPYLLEVKATTRGGACLTPTQALTASSEPTFALCVVDLRNIPSEELDGDWNADRVEPLARIVTNIGQQIEQTWRFVEAARTSPVGIRNDSALRYEVPVAVWESGQTIVDWVQTIRPPLVERT